MKTRVLIVEDNFYKSFTTKQVLTAQLGIEVHFLDVQTTTELAERATEVRPDVIFVRPGGGVIGLLEKLKKRRSNRRNTEITLLLAHDFEDEQVRRFQELVEKTPNLVTARAA